MTEDGATAATEEQKWRQADEAGDAAAKLGVLLEEQGDLAGAEAAYRRADQRGHVDGMFNLGGLLTQQGDVVGAAAAYERADDRGDARAAVNLGVLCEYAGNLPGAAAAYRRADERGDPLGAFNLGTLLARNGDAVGAVAAYRRAQGRNDTEVAALAEEALIALGASCPDVATPTEAAHPSAQEPAAASAAVVPPAPDTQAAPVAAAGTELADETPPAPAAAPFAEDAQRRRLAAAVLPLGRRKLPLVLAAAVAVLAAAVVDVTALVGGTKTTSPKTSRSAAAPGVIATEVAAARPQRQVPNHKLHPTAPAVMTAAAPAPSTRGGAGGGGAAHALKPHATGTGQAQSSSGSAPRTTSATNRAGESPHPGLSASTYVSRTPTGGSESASSRPRAGTGDSGSNGGGVIPRRRWRPPSLIRHDRPAPSLVSAPPSTLAPLELTSRPKGANDVIKTELITAIAADSGLAREHAAKAVDSMLAAVTETLRRVEDVTIPDSPSSPPSTAPPSPATTRPPPPN